MKPSNPTERDEMRILAQWLNARRVLWMHPPNEAKRNVVSAANMKRDGLLHPGCPDVLCFERWSNAPYSGFGIAIELKRPVGPIRVTPEQVRWLNDLRSRGWAATVARGADEAIKFMQARLSL